LASAKDLLAKDWRVVLLDVRVGPLITAELGPSAIFFRRDVSSWECHAAAFAGTFEKWESIDFTALNAGIADKDGFFGPIRGTL
jgi:15-hydroxyprostaglandin dehydrogenase (NAD)